MKRFLCMVLALLAVLTMSVPVMADSSVTGTLDLEDVRDLEFNPVTNTIAYQKWNEDTYTLIDAEGNELATGTYARISECEELFEVIKGDGVNASGFIDGQGNTVVPMQYGDLKYVSPRWQLGIVLEEATAENYDYSTWDSYYLVSAVDVYYNGSMIGTLGRMDYKYAKAYGDYLYIETRDRKAVFYDNTLTASGYEDDYYNDEYDIVYANNTLVYHKGSGQQAFTASCTLTPDQVDQSIYSIDNQFLDLQGNVLFTADQMRMDADLGDYVQVYSTSSGDYKYKYGILDLQGNEILPCEYDRIHSYSSTLFGLGYQIVRKDDKVGFVNDKGEVTCPIVYPYDDVYDYYSPFASVKDADGNYIVLSAQVGELPEHFARISLNSSGICHVFAAENLNGQAGVIDMAGNTVIPFDGTYTSYYQLMVSNDGSVVVGSKGADMYTIYRLEYTPGEVKIAPAAPESAAVSCSNCGYTPADGQIPNFCPECGAQFVPESTVVSCSNCGYTPPDGQIPNFCPECGAQFAK